MNQKFHIPDSWCRKRGRDSKRTFGKLTGLERQKLEFDPTKKERIYVIKIVERREGQKSEFGGMLSCRRQGASRK